MIEDRTTRGPDDPPGGPAVGSRLYVGPGDDPDKYEIWDEGRAGGEGTVYRAMYRGGLQRPLDVAVKEMHRPPSAEVEWPSAQDQRRWRDQTALLQHLCDPHLVKLHEVFAGPPPHRAGLADARPEHTRAYTAMDWVEGQTLATMVRAAPDGRGELDARLGYVRDIAEAIASLHSVTRTGGNPSLHRDVKPTNCIVHPTRGVVLVDVSSMRLVTDGSDPAGLHSPQYSAPEVLANPHRSRRPSCDLYSLGAIAAFCILGQDPPVSPGTHAELRRRLAMVLQDCRAAAPEKAAELVLQMLDQDPDRRPTDPKAWVEHLLKAAGPSRRGELTALMAGAVAVLVIAGGAFAVQGLTTRERPAPSGIVHAPQGGGALSAAEGRIDSPAEGAEVRSCSLLSGTASVPQDVALVLAMRNLDNNEPDQRYVEFTSDRTSPPSSPHWRGVQYFPGSGGQRYEVELLAVPQDLVVAANSAGPEQVDEAVNGLAGQGRVLDTVRVVRVPGEGDCPS